MNKGQTLNGLLIGAVVTAIVCFMGFRSYEQLTKSARTAPELAETENSLNQAFREIVAIGRAADSCQALASADTLTCFVDFGIPRSGTTTRVDITRGVDPVRGGFISISEGAPRNNVRRLWAVGNLEFCDDSSISNSTCPLDLPTRTRLSELHAANLAAAPLTNRTLPNRFFRFRITGELKSVKNHAVPQIQGSFFVRNPIYPSVAGQPDFFYQWSGS